MEKQIDQMQQIDDPWAMADSAKPRDFEYYGQVVADVWFGYFPGGGAKPIPFDPTQHPVDKRSVMIEIQIIPIAEQVVSFDVRQNYTDFSLDWTKITLPSIKALNVDGLKALNGRFVRVAMVDGKREKKDKPGEYYKTFKFLEVYADVDVCKTAYAGHASAHTEQAVPPLNGSAEDAEKAVALQFAKVVVQNKARGLTDRDQIIAAVTEAIAGMPMINKFYTGQSPEILALIDEVMPF